MEPLPMTYDDMRAGKNPVAERQIVDGAHAALTYDQERLGLAARPFGFQKVDALLNSQQALLNSGGGSSTSHGHPFDRSVTISVFGLRTVDPVDPSDGW
jgi:hypothetical protein